MRIVIDLQGAQTGSIYRGIGRYTLAFTEAVLRNRGKHEVFIALSGAFPDSIEPIRARLEGLLPSEAIRVWHIPKPVSHFDCKSASIKRSAEIIREAFLESLRPDIIHITSLFEGFSDNAVSSIGLFDTHTPVSVTLYDLIPYFFADEYLNANEHYKRHYMQKIDYLKLASLLLSISEFSRQDCINLLQIPPDRIVNMSSAVDESFRPLEIDRSTCERLLSKYGISRPFVLYTGGADVRKNLPRLIAAFAMLPKRVRSRYQLVFVGKLQSPVVGFLRQYAYGCGVGKDELVFAGYVDDDDLIKLYNLCELFVFPSCYEGFGLPVLEAMACGCVVICSNVTSMPEVFDLKDALFDPYCVPDISAKMLRALTDEDFRRSVVSYALRRSRGFSWDYTARIAIKAWEAVVDNSKAKKSYASNRPPLYDRLIDSLSVCLKDEPDSELRKVAHCLCLNEVSATDKLDNALKANDGKVFFRFEGPFEGSYSLSIVNRQMALTLERLYSGKVSLFATEGPGDFTPQQSYLDAHPEVNRLYQRGLGQKEAEVVLRLLYPPRVTGMRGRLKIMHNYAWEESAFDWSYVEDFNRLLDGMTVLSNFVKKVMMANGVCLPIEVVGTGVDHLLDVEPVPVDLTTSRAFRFLHVSSCFPRKGVDLLVEAFCRAFTSKDDVCLIIKTFDNPHNNVEFVISDAKRRYPNSPPIEVINQELSEAQMVWLYKHCHCLVAPSRGEGFGMPIAEAMLFGLPVITTGYGGQSDFCTEETAWLIDYRFDKARTHMGLFDSVWVEPELDHLIALLVELHRNHSTGQSGLIGQRVTEAKRLVLERYTWQSCAERLVSFVKALHYNKGLANNRRPLRLGWLSTYKSRCGIAEYSKNLLSHLRPDEFEVFVMADHLSPASDREVIKCWLPLGDDLLEEAISVVFSHRLEAVMVQFNFGFFRLKALANLINRLKDKAIDVFITFHAVKDVDVLGMKASLCEIADSLRRVDLLLVHSVVDLNILKGFGLVDKVILFPHGVTDLRPHPDTAHQNDRPLIGSYGFFLPHKGIRELIQAFAMLRGLGYDYRLRLVNALYPIEQSKLYYEECLSLVKELKLQDYVEFHTDFISEQECLELIAPCTLIALPYQHTRESTSAAVRFALASCRPVLCTPLDIFKDVEEVVFFSKDTTADSLFEALLFIINNPSVVNERLALQMRWLKEHRFSRLTDRLSNIMRCVRYHNC